MSLGPSINGRVSRPSLAPLGLGRVKKARIDVAGRGYGRGAHDLTGSAAVIAAVRNDVHEDLFMTHEARVSVCEQEAHRLLERWRWRAGDVGKEPGVDLPHRRRERMQGRSFFRVRGRVAVSATSKVGLEDAIRDVDVIQDADRGVGFGRMCLFLGFI